MVTAVLCSADEKAAASALLDKLGLTNYQVPFWLVLVGCHMLLGTGKEYRGMLLGPTEGDPRRGSSCQANEWGWHGHATRTISAPMPRCRTLLHVLLHAAQVGKSKVFLRAGQLADLDAMRAEKLNSAARVIQRGVRTCLLRRRFLLMRAGAIKAQALWRGDLGSPCNPPASVTASDVRPGTVLRPHRALPGWCLRMVRSATGWVG